MSLNNIVIEQINDNYYRGEFLGFNLIIDKSTGYFNATKLCNAGNKQFSHWYRSKKTKELLKHVNILRPPHVEGGEYEVKSQQKSVASKEISGTYVCKELILDIASWISPEFYLKCNSIILSHAEAEFKKRHQAEIEEKNCKIDELSRKIDQMCIKHDKEREEDKIRHEQEREELMEKLEAMHDDLTDANNKLDRTLPDHNIDPEDDDLKHNYILLKNKQKTNEYLFVRGQDKYIELKKKNITSYDVIIEKTKNPNPIDLANRLRERIKVINETGYADIIKSIRKSDKYCKGTATQKSLMVTSAQKAKSKVIYLCNKTTIVYFEE